MNSESRELEANPASLPLSGNAPEHDPWLRLFIGPQGLRAGWSIALFSALVYFLALIIGTIESVVFLDGLKLKPASGTPLSMLLGEGQLVGALTIGLLLQARFEHRRASAYYLSTSRMGTRFLYGCITGFAALSALVGSMAAGGWVHISSSGLTYGTLAGFAGLWGIVFLCVGFVEESSFRCYLQFTLSRGINFWWALGTVAAMCGTSLALAHGHGAWGLYAFAVAGLIPCAWLHLRTAQRSAFWQAAWTGSTGFAFVHTFNNGENWIGIFAAAVVGLVFCLSVRLTGSAWWAIGCHASWDWAESFFWGTADSGNVAQGHFLSAVPKGSMFWSGGTDGPEGSILVLPILLLLTLLLFIQYRPQPATDAAQSPLPPAVDLH